MMVDEWASEWTCWSRVSSRNSGWMEGAVERCIDKEEMRV